MIRVAGVQHDIVWEDRDANFERLAPQIAAAAGAGARLVALTEMFSTGFSLDGQRIAEPAGGPSSQFLAAQAREHDVWVCGSIPERDADSDKPYNRLVLAGPDGTMHRYEKIHPFSYAGEHERYTAGSDFGAPTSSSPRPVSTRTKPASVSINRQCATSIAPPTTPEPLINRPPGGRIGAQLRW